MRGDFQKFDELTWNDPNDFSLKMVIQIVPSKMELKMYISCSALGFFTQKVFRVGT